MSEKPRHEPDDARARLLTVLRREFTRGASESHGDTGHASQSGGVQSSTALLAGQPRLEEAEDGSLLRPQRVSPSTDATGALGKRVDQGAIEVRVEHVGVDVAGPADGRCVAELGRDLLDGSNDRLLPAGVVIDLQELAQGE